MIARSASPAATILLALTAFVVSLVAWSAPAFAQAVEISANVDANEIELGDTVTYTLQVTSSSRETPTDPRLAVPSGFTLVDSGASPSTMMSIINGHASEKHGLLAHWRLRSDRLGTFTLGPASVALGAGRKSGTAQTVKVVAPGQARPRPWRKSPRQPAHPLGSGWDPFKGLFPGFDDDGPEEPPSVPTDARLGMDQPRAPVAFLHATVDKTRAVVGEQVTLTVYLYEDLQARQGRPSDVHEATATDFVKRSLLQDETRAIHVGHAIVGGRPWSVKLVRKSALFPIKTGKLSIAPMSLTLPQARVGLRESETLVVDVTEPPVAGRPVGYQIGDTGDFSLSASVAPRNVDQHGAIGVTIELRGTGNLPSVLPMPEIAGVEWLDPQTRDSLGPASAERYGGTRTFSYVVRLHKAGQVDLGEVRLPFYDPQARTYSVARTALGIVQVARATSTRDAGGVDVAEDVLPGLPLPRAALEGPAERTFLTERGAYWGAVFGSPLACAAALALVGVARRARERRASAAPSPDRVARQRRAEADAAMRGGDGKAALAAAARAIEAEIHARTGINVRGTSTEGALRELADAGVDEPAARAILEALSACEDARFSPGGIPMEQAHALWQRATGSLARLGGGRSSPPAARGDG